MHTSFTPRKLKMEVDETQLPFEFKLLFIHLLQPKSQSGIYKTEVVHMCP